jgi:membrane-associated phospholipid phosphatase
MSRFLILAALSGAAGFPAQAPAPASDVVLAWNEAALRAIRADRTPAPQVARHLAMLHVAIHDAVSAVNPTHRFYRFPSTPTGPVSAEAAAAVAAHRILLELYPRQVDACDAALDATLANVPDGEAKEAGVALGQSVAEKVLAWRQGDGSARPMRHPASLAPGLWTPTPPAHKAALLPQWRYLTPFAMRGTTQFTLTDPPTLTSREYTAAFAEVKALGERNSATRTPEQTVIAWFWDDAEGTVTPPGHWNRIAQAVARQRGLSLADSARLFALLNITLADAGILCWECKFRYNLWRPVTAVREADRDGNPDTEPDAAWTPLLTTPNFPAYTSGHSTFSSAAATALALFFGTDEVRFRIGSDGLPGVVRSYPGFWAAAEEAGRSRIYGGIHYDFDNREGLAAGSTLAAFVAENFLLPRDAEVRMALRRPVVQPAIRRKTP